MNLRSVLNVFRKKPTIRKREVPRDDQDPLAAMSDDPEERLAFARVSRIRDVLIAMELCDPDGDVKVAAKETLTRGEDLYHIDGDPRAADYYAKFAP